MVTCPKCGATGEYYFDGLFIECTICGYQEWAATRSDGHSINLYKKWSGQEMPKEEHGTG